MTSSATPIPETALTRRRTDSSPWYRQFWPWFLIALPATAVVFSFATLYIAIEHADEVVHDDDEHAAIVSSSTGESQPMPQARSAGVEHENAPTAPAER